MKGLTPDLWNSLQEKVTYPVRQCRFFFLFSWLMSCTVCIVANINDVESNFFLTALLSIFDLYLLCILSCLLKKIKLGWVVPLLVGLILFLELFIIIFFKTMLTHRTFELAMETNTRETSEFLSVFLLQGKILIPITLFAGMLLLTYLVLRYMSILRSQRKIAMLVLFVLVIWSGARQINYYNKISHFYHLNYIFEFHDWENRYYLATPFGRLAYGIAYTRVLFGKEIEHLERTVAKTQIDSCSFKCPLIIMVIGESYCKHHSQLYNPHSLPTTPRLMNKALQGNLYPYRDVVAPFNRTVETFRYMLSTWDDLSQRPWAEHTLLTAAFKKAGYDVYFFTNQFVPSLDDSYDLYGGRIFNYGKLSEMQFTGRNTQTHQYDEGLLAEIPSLEILSQRPTLLILHLLGQHTDYEERYPDYFKVFKTADVKSKFTDEARRTIIADYENATVYNDFVMDSLFNMFKDEDAIAVYFSDHGEDVFEWRDIHMRTDEENVPQQVAHYQYEVPFMFYMTDRFMERHSDIAEKVKSYVGRPFILTDLPNLMFHLGGIKMQDYHEERDLLSEKYDIHRKRIIRMSIDYDSLMCNFKIN